MTPKKAFEIAVETALFYGERYKHWGPGKVVERLRSSTEGVLANLTVADVSDIRDDEIRKWIDPPTRWDRIRRVFK